MMATTLTFEGRAWHSRGGPGPFRLRQQRRRGRLRIVSVAVDVTDRSQIEAGLEEVHARLK